MIKGAGEIYYGGDYSPDQWDFETIKKDVQSFHKAGINIVTLPVFSWTRLEPEEGVYTFEWLDKVMELFEKENIKVCMATPTAAQPAWLSEKYPEVLPVDRKGRKRTHGMRVFYCVNSEKYRERSRKIAGEMAKRYANNKSLVMWHISNEYGTYCFCDNCRKKFQGWLSKKYGSIEGLNKAWGNNFWNKTYTDFSEVSVPSETNDECRFNPTLNLEYMRFITDSTIECYENEAEAIREFDKAAPIQTNISGHIENLDQFKMAKHMDVVSWDNYPKPGENPGFIAIKHDLMRGLKGGASYMMQEQSPNQQNWQNISKLKRPGEVRMLTYQAIAHGADACLYFQLRQSLSGQEMFHGAVISHVDSTDTRTFKECAQIGKELKELKTAILDGRTASRVGIIFDWDSWWALEKASVNCLPFKSFNYLKKIYEYYKVFYEANIPIDFIEKDSDLSKYDMVIAPYLYIMNEDTAKGLENFTANGGTLIGTLLTGICDEQSKAVYGAYPGLLREVFGLWVEESDPLNESEINILNFTDGESYECKFECDLYHNTTAISLAAYGKDFYEGMSAISLNEYKKGKAYYIGTEPDNAALSKLLLGICGELGIDRELTADLGVEVTRRVNAENELVFLLNWNKNSSVVELGNKTYVNLLSDERLTGTISIPANDIFVLKKFN